MENNENYNEIQQNFIDAIDTDGIAQLDITQLEALLTVLDKVL